MKKPINITLEKQTLKDARELNINISAFTEVKLREYITFLKGKTPDKNPFELIGSQGRLNNTVGSIDLNEYLDTLTLSGISKGWKSTVKKLLVELLTFTKYDVSDNKKVFAFLKQLQKRYSESGYRQRYFQVRKFLQYYDITILDKIKPPKNPEYFTDYIDPSLIDETIKFFKNHKYFLRYKAFIKIGRNTGMRPEEIYQLLPENIDLNKRQIKVCHNPSKNQTTKTRRSRIVYFNTDTKKAIEEYLQYFKNDKWLTRLFEQSHMTQGFKNSPIQAKQLRKIFSQQWTIRGGDYAIKEFIMGHSLKKSVDLSHYCNLPPIEQLKIYDRVMST